MPRFQKPPNQWLAQSIVVKCDLAIITFLMSAFSPMINSLLTIHDYTGWQAAHKPLSCSQ